MISPGLCRSIALTGLFDVSPPPIHSFAILMRLSYALLEDEKKYYRTVINHNILSDEFSGEFDIHPEVKTHQVSKGKG